MASRDFIFTQVGYSVVDKKTKEHNMLLTDISAECKAGHVLAVLGPSGAGKTVLMNTLTLEQGPGSASGNVTLGGAPLTNRLFSEQCAVVTQVDQHWAFLTCREHIEFAVDLHHPSSTAAEKAKEVERLLARMGLESCQNTRAGNMFVQGLSGGQKRRLSLAVALAKHPSLIFLDEPTSGLDAAAAASIMAFLKELASAENIAIVCTIHQPAAAVWSGFDSVMVLSDGRCAYFGKASAMPTYLKGIGKEVPPQSNPAEYILDIVNKDFTSKEEVDRVLDAYAQNPVEIQHVKGTAALAGGTKNDPAPGLCAQTGMLFRRHGKLVYRDPMLYGGRCAMFVGSTIFFALVYIKARSRTQEQVLNRMFGMMWFSGVPAQLACIAVFALNMEAQAIKKEVKNGMYSPTAYVIAHTAIQTPIMLVFSLCSLGISNYVLLAGSPHGFIQTMLTYSAQMWGWECIAQAHSLMPNPLLGMLGFMNVWFTSFLFAGVMIPADDVVWPLRAFVYVFPFRWGLSSMAYSEFIDETFSGARDCDDTDPSCPRGFTCPKDKSGGQVCFGRDGQDVIESVHQNFEFIPKNDVFARNLGILIAIAVVFKIAFIVGLNKLCSAGKQPTAPERSKHGSRGPSKKVQDGVSVELPPAV